MSRRRMKSRRARAAIAVQRESLPPGVSLRGFRKPRGERKRSGSHDQERERRRRQMERGALRPTVEVPWPVAAAALEAEQSERDTLIAQHDTLVRHIAQQLFLTDQTVPLKGLIEAGTRGLTAASDAFDPERGIAFSTFAAPRIRGAILDRIRSEGKSHA